MGFFDWFTNNISQPGRQTNLEAGKNERIATNPLGPGGGGTVFAKDPLAQPTPTKLEQPVKTRTRRTGTATTAKATDKKDVKPELPKAAEGAQPQLELGTNKDPRFSVTGTKYSQYFDINSFRSEVSSNDVLPSHSYLVTFAPFRTGFPENTPLTEFVTNKRNTLVLRCENIILPTPSLLEEEAIRRYGYGPVEKVPYGVQFSDVTMTWLVDSKSEIIDFMHQWMNTIVMHDTPNALMSGSTTRQGLQNYKSFEVGYKDAYANPIVRVYVYNRQSQKVTEYELYDVFPMNIQSINLSWADENQLQKLTVTFSYTNMQVKAPLKTTEKQLNNIAERIFEKQEKQQPDNKGGKAAADAKDSPVGEVSVKTVQSSIPNATTKQPQAPTAAITTATPLVRNLTQT